MIKIFIRSLFPVLLLSFYIQLSASSQADVTDKQMMVTMRMIGDEVLKSMGDKTSKVSVNEVLDGYYKIGFESEFAILPDSLVKTIDGAMKKRSFEQGYLVEVQERDTEQFVHSYEMAASKGEPKSLNCGARAMDKNCYNLFITIVKKTVVVQERLSRGEHQNTSFLSKILFLLGLIPVAFLLWKFYAMKKETFSTQKVDNSIRIGAYRFDEVTLELTYEANKVELSGKEADLLLILHKNRNTVIEREKLLSEVWSDEGDYVGRTLDVFISKLRKRLEGDPSLKIVNIRGVGYKLIVSEVVV